MGRREGSAGSGHSFRRLWMHSFPTLTVSSVLASRPPGCGSLPTGSLLEVVTSAGWAIPSPGFCSSSSVLPLAAPPPLPQHPGLRSRPAQPLCSGPWSASPPRPPPLLSHSSGASSSPIIHDTVTSVRARGKTDGFRESGKFQEDYLQRGLLSKWAGPRGVKGTSG